MFQRLAVMLFATCSSLSAQLFSLDAVPGPASSNPAEILAADDLLYFTIKGSASGPSYLFRWDGNLTRLDLRAGNPYSPRYLLNDGRVLYLSAQTANGQELVVLFPNGSHRVIDVRPGSTGSAPQELAWHRGELYFSADVPAEGGRVLYRYDRGSDRLQVAWAGSGVSPGPTQLTSAGSLLFFAATVPGGVRRLHVLDSNTGTVTELPPAAVPDELTAVGSRVFFRANGPTGDELYVSDGTVAGTLSPRDIFPGSGSSPGDLVAFEGKCFFAASEGRGSGQRGRELWESDGTFAGTRLVADLNPNRGTSDPRALTVAGNTLFFVARPSASIGAEMHAYQSAWGTPRLLSVNSSGDAFGNAAKVGAIGESLVLAGALPNTSTGREPHLYTEAGGSLLVNVAIVGASLPESFVTTGSHAFFVADDQGTPPSPLTPAGREVWGFPIAAAGIGSCNAYGTGCAGPAPAPTLACSSRPAFGNAGFALIAQDVRPNAPALLLAGTGRVRSGIACSLLISNPLTSFAFVADAAGRITVPMPIGNLQRFAGTAVTFQLLPFDPTSPNGVFATTNGLLTILGS